MTTKISAPRGADFQMSYIFPDETSFVGYDGSFSVYSVPNGTTLLSFSETPTPNSSQMAFVGNIITVTIKKADIDNLPVDASDSTSPSILQFDLFITDAGGTVSKIHGGAFLVQPYGASLTSNATQIDVSLNGVEVNVSLQNGASFTVSPTGSVRFDTAQSLTGGQQAVARGNIGVYSTTEIATILGSYASLAALAIPATGGSLVGYVNGFTGSVNRTVRDRLRDFSTAADGGALGDNASNNTTAFSALVAASAGYASGRKMLFGPGIYKFNSVTMSARQNVVWEGAGIDKTVLTFFVTGASALISLVNCQNVEFRNMTVNVIGGSMQAFNVDNNCQKIRWTQVNVVGDNAGDLIRNEGDTTTFIGEAYNPSNANWFMGFWKDARALSTRPFKGNNHDVTVIQYGGPTGLGGGGVRFMQYNYAGLTNSQRTTNRVEGATIRGSKFISDAPTNVYIGNSLYVAVEDTICDQATDACIIIDDLAEAASISDFYVGSDNGTTNKTGIRVTSTVGTGTNITNGEGYNVDYVVDVQASAGSVVSDVAIDRVTGAFVGKSLLRLDSVKSAQIINCRDNSTISTDGSIQTLSTNTGSGRNYTLVGNVFRTTTPSNWDASAVYLAAACFGWGSKYNAGTVEFAGASGVTIAPGQTRYITNIMDATENHAWLPATCDRVMQGFFFTANDPVSASGFLTLTLRLSPPNGNSSSGVSQAMTATLTGNSTYDVSDFSHPVFIPKGYRWCFMAAYTGSGGSVTGALACRIANLTTE